MTRFYLDFFMEIGLVLIFLGLSGILVNKLNIIISIICIEIMFYGINFYLITTGLNVKDVIGQLASLFVLTIAAAESAIALALIMTFFKIFKDILLKDN